MLDRDRSEGIVIGGDPYAIDAKIHGERQNAAAHDYNHSPEKDSPQPLSQIRFLAFGHEAKL